jgi:Glycosyltransferase family 87
MSVIVLRPPPADTAHRPKFPWPAAGPVRRPWVAAVFVMCACFAGGTAAITTNSLHRIWGLAAAGAYAAAAAAALAWRSRGVDLALVIAISGAVLGPLAWMTTTGQGQPEVAVVARSAGMLVSHGDPYESQAQIAPTRDPNAYNPYLPALTVFGLPRALRWPRPLADPRLWFGVSFAVILMFALARARAPDPWRWAALIIATPVIAQPIVVGGTDLPVLALMCLGLAFLRAEPRPILAGLALGVAAAMKATAWPTLIVAIPLLVTSGGWRSMAKFAATAAAVCAAVVAPFALLWPRALVQNTIMFPLGLTKIKSQAASPLPGHMLAQMGAAGHLAAVALLATAGLAVAASLVVRPPADARSAALRLAIGLALMFTLAPATRFGYFSYPAALLFWLWLAGPERPAMVTAGPAGPGEGVLAAVI